MVFRINNRLTCKINVLDIFQFSSPVALGHRIKSGSEESCARKAPDYLELHSRKDSRATIVLIHGFWGQGKIFSSLVPSLDDTFDVLIIHDPFFGKSEHPESVTEWAKLYLNDVKKQLPRDHAIILGGYSFGGLIAFEMASLWRKWYGTDPASVILLDTSTYPLVNLFFRDRGQSEQELDYALRIFGEDLKTLVQEHFEKLRLLTNKWNEPPIYRSNCLYFFTQQAAKAEAPEWWAARCPQLQMHYLDCTHHAVLGDAMISSVSGLINEHSRLVTADSAQLEANV
ncbi:hypothetical protein MMC17_010118 [Xylographa soralifera]|nr:hypothetical protein [Xylographa soralifera]